MIDNHPATWEQAGDIFLFITLGAVIEAIAIAIAVYRDGFSVRSMFIFFEGLACVCATLCFVGAAWGAWELKKELYRGGKG